MKTTLLLLLSFFTYAITHAQSTSLQLIHNCADPAVANISIWVEDGFGTFRIEDNFKFREATGFKPFPAARPTTIAITPAGANIRDSIAGLTTVVNLDVNNSYIIMMAGNIDTGYKANPDGVDTKFKLLIIEKARVYPFTAGKTEAIIINGSTDAPTIDMVVEGTNTTLANDIKYGDASGYTALNDIQYRFLVQDKDNSNTLGAFLAPFDNGDFTGQAPIVFSSGYVSPQENKNGAAQAWFAVVADKVTPLTNVTSVNELLKEIETKLYPNPATTNLNIEFTLTNNSPLILEIFDNLGRTVYTETTTGIAGSNSLKINTTTFKTGMYFYTLKTKEGINTTRFAVSK